MPDTPPPETLRLFIALPVPEGIKTEIEKAQAELRRALAPGCVRWTRREQFHLTLRFLGDVEAQRFEPLAEGVRGACAGLAALELSAERIGFFPDARRPRVVWVGVQDQREELSRLQRAVEAASREFTAEPAGEKFSGHVTLGRIKAIRRTEAEVLAKVVSGLAGRFFGAWTADNVEIMRSQLSPEGARHSTLAAIPLAKGP